MHIFLSQWYMLLYTEMGDRRRSTNNINEVSPNRRQLVSIFTCRICNMKFQSHQDLMMSDHQDRNVHGEPYQVRVEMVRQMIERDHYHSRVFVYDNFGTPTPPSLFYLPPSPPNIYTPMHRPFIQAPVVTAPVVALGIPSYMMQLNHPQLVLMPTHGPPMV